MMPNPTTDMSLKALSLTEQSMKAAFHHAKKLFSPKTYKSNEASIRIFEGTVAAATERLTGMGGNVQRSSPDRSEKDVEIK